MKPRTLTQKEQVYLARLKKRSILLWSIAHKLARTPDESRLQVALSMMQESPRMIDDITTMCNRVNRLIKSQ